MLTGKEIKRQIELGNIEITNFDEKRLNPNSYNVTLADEIITYKSDRLDMAKENEVQIGVIPNDGKWLQPNELYLARIKEKCFTNKFIPCIDGRSSVGRLGINIHATAGFGDVGFNGYFTLEISVVKPVKIYPNVEIGQIYFYEPQGEITLYNGKYQNNNGVQSSRIHKDFKED